MRRLTVVFFDRALEYGTGSRNKIFGDYARYIDLRSRLDERDPQEIKILESVYADTNTVKIAVVEDNYEMNPAINLSKFDLVIVTSVEIIVRDNFVSSCRRKYNNPNVFVLIGGKIEWLIDEPEVYYYPFVLLLPGIINSYRPTNNHLSKAKLFDCLLGGFKPHREFIFNQLKEHKLLNLCYVNLLRSSYSPNVQDIINQGTYYRSADLDLVESSNALEAKESTNGVFYSMVENIQHQLMYRISNQVPWEVYKNSHYSIIAETNYNSPFLTEKTGKAILAKRVFVMFAARHHLRELRSLGFQTFDGILDESYDDIEDNEQRWAEAFKQVLWLANQDPVEIYKQAESILQYNYLKFLDHQSFIQPMRKWLLEKLRTVAVDITFK